MQKIHIHIYISKLWKINLSSFSFSVFTTSLSTGDWIFVVNYKRSCGPDWLLAGQERFHRSFTRGLPGLTGVSSLAILSVKLWLPTTELESSHKDKDKLEHFFINSNNAMTLIRLHFHCSLFFIVFMFPSSIMTTIKQNTLCLPSTIPELYYATID